MVNGVTKIFRRVITTQDQKPFFKLYLPERNVLGVTGMIHKEGTSFAGNPTASEFVNTDKKWYEVQSLVQEKVFVPNTTAVSDKNNFKAGQYIRVSNKFITEYTPEGYFSITFGSGNVDPLDNLDNYITNNLKVNLGTYLNNLSLGALPKADNTLFVKYRIGGGKESNLGVNVITSIENVEFSVIGPNTTFNDNVTQSLTVTNITPAVGGSDQPVTEELRNMIAYNFAAQNRAVTLNDYKSMIEGMPSAFGAPAKVNVMEEDNKVRIKLLSYDENGNLTDIVSNTLKNNILSYLSEYRMINDYLDIVSGQVIDLGLEIDILLDKNQNQTEVLRQIITNTTTYFSIDNRKMGDPLFVGELTKAIHDVPGVVNVIDVRVFNKIGGEYSSSEVSQAYKDSVTKEIAQSDMTIFMKSNQIFQIRFPNKDIKIRVKTLGTTTY